MEAIANELKDITAALSEAVSTANHTELEGDPSAMINNFRETANEANTEYMEFEEQNNKELETSRN